MKRFFIASFVFLSAVSSLQAQGALAGKMNCEVVGGNVVSDGRGSSIRYLNGTLDISETGEVSFSTLAKFKIVGRSPYSENLYIKGKGGFSDTSSVSSGLSFAVAPEKNVLYRGKSIKGNLTGRVTLNKFVKYAHLKINSWIGRTELVCK